MCLLGKTKWKQLPVYIVAQYIGAIFGSLILFLIYYGICVMPLKPSHIYYNYCFVLDAINTFDGGVRQVYGPNATAGIFATYPLDYVSTGSCFVDQVCNMCFHILLYEEQSNLSGDGNCHSVIMCACDN